MHNWLLTPPIVFLIVLGFVWFLSCLFSRLAFRPKNKAEGEGAPYACGEPNYNPMAQPDYTTFFPYAFFFTLAHVATLMMTTVPVESLRAFVLAAMYVGGAALGLYILFRR